MQDNIVVFFVFQLVSELAGVNFVFLGILIKIRAALRAVIDLHLYARRTAKRLELYRNTVEIRFAVADEEKLFRFLVARCRIVVFNGQLFRFSVDSRLYDIIDRHGGIIKHRALHDRTVKRIQPADTVIRDNETACRNGHRKLRAAETFVHV